MLHVINLVLFNFFWIGCGTTKDMGADGFILNGSWIPIRQEISGKDFQDVFFQSQKLIIIDSTYSMQAESLDKGTLKYRSGKMDIYGKEGVNRGKHFMAIYRLDRDQLTICYNMKADGYPTGFETESKESLFLSVYRRE